MIGSLALLASWFPAWRAAGLPPMIAIRNDMGSVWQESKLHYRQLLERATADRPLTDMGVEQATLFRIWLLPGVKPNRFLRPSRPRCKLCARNSKRTKRCCWRNSP